MEKHALSINEFCSRYSVGRTKTYAEISSGRLRAVKFGRRTLVTKEDAEAWLAALPKSKALLPTSQSELIRKIAIKQTSALKGKP